MEKSHFLQFLLSITEYAQLDLITWDVCMDFT